MSLNLPVFDKNQILFFETACELHSILSGLSNFRNCRLSNPLNELKLQKITSHGDFWYMSYTNSSQQAIISFRTNYVISNIKLFPVLRTSKDSKAYTISHLNSFLAETKEMDELQIQLSYPKQVIPISPKYYEYDENKNISIEDIINTMKFYIEEIKNEFKPSSI